MRDLTPIALRLLENGFTPLRLEPGEKYTKAAGWSTDTPTPQKIERAFARPSNLGVRLGDPLPDGSYLIAIDIDIEEALLIRAVERAIGEKVPIKRGKKGYTYFVRIDRLVKTHKIYWSRNDKKTAAIDVLAKGAQTVLPPSIHPDTKQPYTWISQVSLEDIDVRTLPIFSPTLLDEIRGFAKDAEDKIYPLNDMEWLGVGKGGNTHDVCVAAVSSMVARKWPDEDIQSRIQRAKKEAAEVAGLAYNWPEADRTIQEWIDSARDKKFDTTSKAKTGDIPLDIVNRYAYIIELDRMYDLEKGILLNNAQFNNIHGRDFAAPNKQWATIILHPDLRIIDRLTYAPGQPRFSKEKSFDSDATLDCINTYVPADIEPEEGDVEPWVTLVKDVCDGVPAAYEHIFSFLAFLIQYPGQRINHALVIQGRQGIGKDSIFLALTAVLGQHNATQVTLQHVESQFNDWLFGKQLILFQEMLAAGRRSVYNKLKTYLTDPLHTINGKHLPLRRVHNRANYVFLSNYKHALSIDPSDRRMWVWYSQMMPKGPEYYNRFYRWLSDPRSAQHLFDWLLKYDTSKFNPTAPPPMTDAKRTMIKASSSEVEQFLHEATEAGAWPMECDIVSPTHIFSAIRPLMRVSLSMVYEALDNIAGEHGEVLIRPVVGTQRLKLRAIRNQEKWASASGPELARAYRMPLPPQTGETLGTYVSLVADGRPVQPKHEPEVVGLKKPEF